MCNRFCKGASAPFRKLIPQRQIVGNCYVKTPLERMQQKTKSYYVFCVKGMK